MMEAAQEAAVHPPRAAAKEDALKGGHHRRWLKRAIGIEVALLRVVPVEQQSNERGMVAIEETLELAAGPAQRIQVHAA
eukprot:CAMPEP_0115841694 /NCGR_PEP_ID=MMETSP0287-20121206/7419_1 /TAXON_ID=412157 /ORGANISM="Chrysochromulina rotalis, Strain UIO044" /LENGTH=78 /DNA_ID=CAMNT_0003295345 /DNA_START=488 /DNA_END=721 /DNA_ORIENTATION=-